MNIQYDQNYKNKTWKFLVPLLKSYGPVFIVKFNSSYKLAVGIHDTLLDGSDIVDDKSKNCIFILIDKQGRENGQFIFEDFLEYCKNQSYYVADYCPEGDFQKSRQHMIVIEFPKVYSDAYHLFMAGQYSEMCIDADLEKYFSSDHNKEALQIMKKEPNEQLITTFLQNLSNKFGAVFNSIEPFKEKNNGEYPELELPPDMEEEIFNY